jgi:SHS2 domain-containing protein
VFRWVDHTSEVELELAGESREEVFREALAALADLLGAARDGGDGWEQRRVDVAAADPPALLAVFLEELVYLAEVHGFVALEAPELEVGDGHVRAHLRGRVGEAPPLVKAVTYHRLLLEEEASGWTGRVVLDV